MKYDLETELSITGSRLRVEGCIARCNLAIIEAEATLRANQILRAEYQSQYEDWTAALELCRKGKKSK